MAIQVITLPAPTSGVDWTWTVPGQWLPYLYGVQAELVTTSSVTAFPDETGNGNSAAFNTGNGYTLGAPGPYAGGANNFGVFHSATFVGSNVGAGTTGVMSALGPAAFTIETWAKVISDPAANGFDFLGVMNAGLSAELTSMSSSTNNHDPYDWEQSQNGGKLFVVAGVASRNAWHHLALTYDGTSYRWYTDGALVSTVAGGAPALSGNPFRVDVCGDQYRGQMRGTCAGQAFYTSALSGATIAAHAAANASWATYRAAVLASSPLALWGLNTIPSLQNRQVTLVVTDGTNTLGQFPASFPTATAAGFIWSWQANLANAQTSPDGTVNSVPIPELEVSSGYTIGVKTLDLQPTDDWQNITLWFDDGQGQGGGTGGGPGSGGYLDATLYPDTYLGG